jgi:hypothetical protein
MASAQAVSGVMMLVSSAKSGAMFVFDSINQ